MKTILPTFYTDKEGGHFKPWVRGSINISDLTPLNDYNYYNNSTIKVNNIDVHSLIFGEDSDCPRWDCLNGWTTPILSGDK